MSARSTTRLPVLRSHEGPAEERGLAAVVLLTRVQGRIRDAFSEQLKQHGITLPHFDVLVTLKTGEGISQQDLSERLLVTKGNTCVIVQKMEQAGLIERRTDPTDQRFQRLYLADAGRRLLARILPEHQALMRQFLAGLNHEQHKTLYELLSRIDQNLDGMEP